MKKDEKNWKNNFQVTLILIYSHILCAFFKNHFLFLLLLHYDFTLVACFTEDFRLEDSQVLLLYFLLPVVKDRD